MHLNYQEHYFNIKGCNQFFFVMQQTRLVSGRRKMIIEVEIHKEK